MQRHRTVTIASLALALVGVPARAAGNRTLDGVRHTQLTYTGSLNRPALPVATDRARLDDPLVPQLTDCTVASCDVTRLRLTVPRTAPGGRFAVNLLVERTLSLYVALYDAKGVEKYAVQTAPSNDGSCCVTYVQPKNTAGTVQWYELSFALGRLPAGTYTLAVYDRGGTGAFSAVVDYRALHTARTKS